MEIIKNYVHEMDYLIKKFQNGKSTDWKRTYFLRDLTSGKIAVVALNFFERMICNIGKLFCLKRKVKFIQNSELLDLVINKTNAQAKVEWKIDPVELKEPKEPVREIPAEPIPVIEKQEDIPLEPIQNKISLPEVKIEEPILTPSQIVINYIQNGDLEAALEANKNVPLEERNNHYCNIAKAYGHRDDFEQMVAILDNRNLVSFYGSWRIYEELALTCCRKGDYKNSKRFINKAFKNENQITEMFFNIAQEDYQRGDLKKALEGLSQIENKKRDDVQNLYNKIREEYVQHIPKNEVPKHYILK